jgi:H+/Na+-translocating ferredoxin:NAD+ oxidoreductase subunit G
MREMISMVVVLTVLTAISGGLLASIEKGTKDRIATQIFKFQLAPAMNEIFGEVENDPAKEQFQIEHEGMTYTFYPAKRDDGSTAVAFETKGKGGYGGNVGLMVGINLDNDQIVAAKVTTHAETPGLGARAKDDPEFVSQFAEKAMDVNFALKGDGGSIDAMSGATITSRAVTLAAIQAQDLYKKLKPEILKQVK